MNCFDFFLNIAMGQNACCVCVCVRTFCMNILYFTVRSGYNVLLRCFLQVCFFKYFFKNQEMLSLL